MGVAWTHILLSLLISSSPLRADVCGPSSDPSTWGTAAVSIVDDIVSFIPEVGPWIAAAGDILNTIFSQGSKYTEDVTACVEHLITQEIENNTIEQTKKFLEDWQPVLAEWKDAPVTSNASDTKAILAGRLYAMAASGPLTYLPLIEKQETVLTFWFDMA